MKTLFIRFLCWLGWHRWTKTGTVDGLETYRCADCQKEIER